MDCSPYATPEELAERPSPYDSVTVTVGNASAKICYSRPSARGRTVFGELVPWDTLWRTGANEPTIIHLDSDAEIAGMAVEAGSYSIYTLPGQEQWLVVVNRSIGQWGQTRALPRADGTMGESSYTPEVEAQEVGRAPIEIEEIEHVEMFTTSFGPPSGSATDIRFDWETTRIVVPVRFTTPEP